MEKQACNNGTVILEAKTNIEFEGWFEQTGNRYGISKQLKIKTDYPLTLIARSRYGSDLITNGSFEQGNVGFESDYHYFSGTNDKHSYYLVGSNPEEFVNAYTRQKDVTSGSGKMLIADGNIDNAKAVYRAFPRVKSNDIYKISLWVCNIHDEFSKPAPDTTKQSVPVIQLFIEDSLLLTYPVPADTVWHQLNLNWSAHKTADVKFEIKTRSASIRGNDFALDEIKFMSASGSISDSITVQSCNNLEPVLTPDGDGLYDSYYIQESGIAKVIDLNGNVINEIKSPASWDGTHGNGSIADAGYYAIVVNDKVFRVSVIR